MSPRSSSVARGIGRDAVVALIVVILVAAPLLFTRSGFALDFTNSLWLAWAAGKEPSQQATPPTFSTRA